MPSQILHALFGEDFLAALDRNFGCCPIEEACRSIFALGCQGPDIFYHSQMTRPVGLEYGTLLHRRGYGTFTAALFDLALGEGALKADYAAYAWGFATHAVLDRACHPYIVCRTARPDKGGGEGKLHAFFERILDALMLEALRGKPVASWDQDSLARICGDPPQGLKELLAEALRRAFPERAGGDAQLLRRMDSAFRDCAFFYRHTCPAKTSFLAPRLAPAEQEAFQRRMAEELPLAYLHPEALPGGIDYLNLKHRTWHYPLEEGGPDTRSFPDIYAQGLEAALEILGPLAAELLETGSLPGSEEIARRVGDNGLSIQDRNGKPATASRSEPLPLEQVLEQQRQARLGVKRPSWKGRPRLMGD
ncbi:MAG: zinc dependent phospholipase C family protein [Treponema sp.]|nr:zinc dependent phospholipase C family protein [Treponema sp.]